MKEFKKYYRKKIITLQLYNSFYSAFPAYRRRNPQFEFRIAFIGWSPKP